jgi:uncharacterized phiE125 gp8 family phage protein
MVKLVSTLGDPPVSLEEVKHHLRIIGNDEDAYLNILIASATDAAEQFTRRSLIPALWDLYLDAFPPGAVDLPFPPLVDVESIHYRDPEGVGRYLTTFAVDTVKHRVRPEFGECWPATRAEPNAVRIPYRTGYAEAPASIKSAVLLLIGDLYENREAQGPVIHENTIYARLLWPYRVWQ